jgi:hypothetical protein
MSKESPKYVFSKSSKLVLLSGIIVAVFWWQAKTSNIYQNAAVGAIFEILWLPMLAALFILPVISLIFWRKEKFNARSLYLYAMLIGVFAAVYTIVK